MSKNKAKGTSAETALVNYLKVNGFPLAERKAMQGANDAGDVTGTIGLAWEVKNHRTYKIPAWLEELEVETENAGADFGVLVVKPVGVGITRVESWWAVMPVGELVELVREAGYGDANDAASSI
jgi:Holliday junction resolvase